MDLKTRSDETRCVRRWASDQFELRADDDTGELRFAGEASVVEHPYTVHDMFGEFTETIARGAFDKTLSESPDVMFLVNHAGHPLARTKSGTMKLSADPHLSVEATLNPHTPADVVEAIRRRDMDEMSFAFRVVRQEWDEDYTERRILEVNLNKGDVSVVNFGANPATSGALRSLDIEASELDEALTALKAGTATDDQRSIVERASVALTDALVVPDGDEAERVAASLAADYAALGPRPLDPILL